MMKSTIILLVALLCAPALAHEGRECPNLSARIEKVRRVEIIAKSSANVNERIEEILQIDPRAYISTPIAGDSWFVVRVEYCEILELQ